MDVDVEHDGPWRFYVERRRLLMPLPGSRCGRRHSRQGHVSAMYAAEAYSRSEL